MPRPPVLARALVALLLRGTRREVVGGDLEEEFADRLASGVPIRMAKRRYWRHALASIAWSWPMRRPALLDMEKEASPWNARAWAGLEGIWRDIRQGVRIARRQPGFSLIAISTLALGIGATTTVFSVAEHEIWRPLRFQTPDRLVALSSTSVQRPDFNHGLSPREIRASRDAGRSLDALAGFGWSTSHILTGAGNAERVTATAVTVNFFDTLRSQASIGRTFRADDGRAGASHAAVLSYPFWIRHFEGDPAVISRPFLLDGEPYEVIGILPETFHLEIIADPDLFIPWELPSDAVTAADDPSINVIGRLKPQVSLAAAEAELAPVVSRLNQGRPSRADRLLRVRDLHEAYASHTWRTFFLFLAAALVLVIVACANVASLLLARAFGRYREFVVRAALGGSRPRLLRQLFLEGLVIAFAAGGLGVFLARWGADAFSALAPADYLTRGPIELDTRVLLSALLLTALTTIVFALAPAAVAPREGVRAAIGGGGRTVTDDRRQRRARGLFVLAEVTLAFVLLFGAGILASSFLRLHRIPLGFEPANLVTSRMLLKGPRYASPQQVADAYAQLAARVRQVPGVEAVALGSSVPFLGGEWMPFNIGGRPASLGKTAPYTLVHVVSPEYLEVLKTHLLVGRGITQADAGGAPRVAMINQNLAQHFFKEGSPVGQTLDLLSGGSSSDFKTGTVQIVGIVENTTEVGLDELPFDGIYVPFRQNPVPSMYFIVKARTETASVLTAIRREVAGFDPDLPVYGIATMDQRVASAFQSNRFNLVFFGAFAVLAALLASIGVYGSTAYDVAQRTREFGLRMALGARREWVLGTAIGQSARLGVIGLLLGIVVVTIAARLLGDSLYLVRGAHGGLVYQVSLSDPLTLAGTCCVIIGVTLVAAYVPALRATRVDPMTALREQ